MYASVEEALDGVDVLIDYTSHDVVKANTLTAIERGVAVVIGTSGLTADDFAEIDEAARARGVGVISSGNFSRDRGDGAGRGAAGRAAHPVVGGDRLRERRQGRRPERHRPRAGRAARRGRRSSARSRRRRACARRAAATIGGTQVHSLRLPSFTVSTEVVFGLPDERLSIRHDAGSSAAPYVAGTLLAARAAPTTVGVVRGLATLLLRD